MAELNDGQAVEWMSIIAERKIQQAIDDGWFDNLPGAGKPLDLSVNPFEAPGTAAFNSILRRNGVLPEWAQLEKAIETAKAEAKGTMERFRSRTAGRAPGPDYPRERAAVRADYERHLRLANDLILKHRLTAGFTHRAPLNLCIDDLLAEFDRSFPVPHSAEDAL